MIIVLSLVVGLTFLQQTEWLAHDTTGLRLFASYFSSGGRMQHSWFHWYVGFALEASLSISGLLLYCLVT